MHRFGFAPNVSLAMQSNLAAMQTLQGEIGVIEKRLMERVKLRPEYALMNSVPGIGPVLAITIMLERRTISRFAKVGNFSSYCRFMGSRRVHHRAAEGPCGPASEVARWHDQRFPSSSGWQTLH